MRRFSIIVKATWDDEAKVWVAESTDIEGLATEAETVEELRAKIFAMIPELLALNGANGLVPELPEIPVHLMIEQSARIPNPRYS